MPPPEALYSVRGMWEATPMTPYSTVPDDFEKMRVKKVLRGIWRGSNPLFIGRMGPMMLECEGRQRGSRKRCEICRGSLRYVIPFGETSFQKSDHQMWRERKHRYDISEVTNNAAEGQEFRLRLTEPIREENSTLS